MGSDFSNEFYTLEESKNRLNRSLRSLHYYVRDGLLRKELRDGQIVLRKEDVEQLAIELGTDAPAMNRKTFLQLAAKVRQLETTMAVVRRRLDISPPLRPTLEEALNLHRAATRALAKGQWDIKEAGVWTAIFEGLDEVALEKVGEAIHAAKPWMIFYELCLALMKRVSYQPDFATSLELQSAHQLLDLSRKKLREVIVVWTELGRGSLTPTALKDLDSDVDDVMKRITSKKT